MKIVAHKGKLNLKSIYLNLVKINFIFGKVTVKYKEVIDIMEY